MSKVKGRAEQFKGEFEQAVSRTAGSMETQARGMADESKVTVRAKVAQFKRKAGKEAGDASERIGELRGKAQTAASHRNITRIAIGVVAVLIVLAIVSRLRNGLRAAQPGDWQI